MQDEWMDLVDDNDQVIGKKLRSEIYAEKLFNFRVVNGFLKNDQGEIWVPRRAPHKKNFPDCLDMSVAGHVESGESYDQAFAREASEELNIDVRDYDVKLLGHLSQKDGVSVFMQVYEVSANDSPDYNKDEFIEAVWLKPADLAKRIQNGDKSKSDLPPLLRLFYGCNI